MNTATITERDSRVKAYYRLAGTRISHSIFGSSKHPAEGVVCVTSDYEVRQLDGWVPGTSKRVDNLLLDNGEFYPTAHVTLAELRPATDVEVAAYTATLASRNLEIGEAVLTRTYLAGLVERERICTLQFIDPAAIPYRLGDCDLTRAEFESLEIPSGQSLLRHFDNGYSYSGVNPTTKAAFLKSVDDELVNKGRFITEKYGVQLTRRNPTEQYAVKVIIGQDASRSEVSFS